MKTLTRLVIVVGLGLLQSSCITAAPTTYKVYYLGGQSNMEGFGFTEKLAEDQRSVSDDVMIFAGQPAFDDDVGGGVGTWDALQPGYGMGFRTDGSQNQHSDRFGPELYFGKTMLTPTRGENIAIIKYSLGGSGLAAGVGYGSWDPDYENGEGINQYDNAVTTLRNALSVADIDGDGKADRLVPAGIVWMQGEADAYDSQEAADAYEANLTRMMNLLRDALGSRELPIVIGKITDSGMADDGTVMDYIGTVQAAQAEFVAADSCATYVTDMDDYEYLPDGWHYDTLGFVAMGTAFARAMVELQSSCPQ